MAHGYLIFHLNLAYSSIPTEARSEVIRKCYWPLLYLAEDTGIPVGIELTGGTLQRISELDLNWVDYFRKMLEKEQCELIGSGWSQIIGPLVPYEVNCWNQKLGLQAYQRILGVIPNSALVNEMAFSTGMVDIYAKAGYKGIIMDRDNVRLALELGLEPISSMPTRALGCGITSLPVLWSDSILFQRLQRVVHGDIPFSEYMAYIKQRMNQDNCPLPIYCNDAEIFDYRPGRFATESRVHIEGEWERLQRLCKQLKNELSLIWLSPKKALALQNSNLKPNIKRLSSAHHPIPVKKQAKYNINRWALTGRNDLWLNTACYRIYRDLVQNNDASDKNWRELCRLWASDLRTHITAARWNEAVTRVLKFKHQRGLEEIKSNELKAAKLKSVSKRTFPKGFVIDQNGEGLHWTIKTNLLCAVMNVRRGLTIKSLAFKSHNFEPVVGTLSQGYFRSIELGADFYTGGVIIEMPGERIRMTDLEWVNPYTEHKGNEISVIASVNFGQTTLKKTIVFDTESERVRMSYDFGQWQRPLGIVRVGIITFMTESFSMPLTMCCKNGGNKAESFTLGTTFNHGRAASTFVSSTTAFGATDGSILVNDKKGPKLQLLWDPAACAAIPMLQHQTDYDRYFTRLFFSLCELDDTSRAGGKILPFSLELRGIEL